MAYEPTVWKKGDIVTSEKLNKLENGVAAGGVLVVGVTFDMQTSTATLDKTAGEIWNAGFAVLKIDLEQIGGNGESIESFSYMGYNSDDDYVFIAPVNGGDTQFFAATADDYPTASQD